MGAFQRLATSPTPSAISSILGRQESGIAMAISIPTGAAPIAARSLNAAAAAR
jgi:hypothetical protein